MPKAVVRIDRAKLARSRSVDEAMGKIASAVAAQARIEAPVDTGKLQRNIRRRRDRDGRWVVQAETRYAMWQHDGTGIYGPRRAPIRPVRARMLVFYWKKVGHVVAFPSVRGTPPNPFLARAVAKVLGPSALRRRR